MSKTWRERIAGGIGLREVDVARALVELSAANKALAERLEVVESWHVDGEPEAVETPASAPAKATGRAIKDAPQA